jgi:3-oxoacyl-[acyl-carrier protein] reductase
MNKVALITGGTRGIGLGIAQALADLGFDLAINGVREEQLVTEVLNDLRKKNIKVIYCQGDIATEASRKAILDKIKTEFGQLNLLVNNAGVAPKDRKDILETTEESYDFVLDTNLKGTYFLTQVVANFMVEQKNKNQNFEGTIINVSSISATVASVNRGEYCVAKAGLSMVTQLFAVRLGEYGIPVYEIRPGIIKTDMTEKVTEKYDKLIAEGLCVQARWGVPSDIGKAVAALAKGDFMYSTGQVFTIDGGLTLARL